MIQIANPGKQFETNIENSCDKEDIFFFRVRDVFLPPDVRKRVRLPKNRYDSLIFNNGHLFPVELKSTKDKSISLAESVIKSHQIDNLEQASHFEGVIPGFIFNFREPDNLTYFIHIEDFLTYQHYATTQEQHPYQIRKGKKLNRASISLDICQEIGIEIMSVKKRVHHHYFLKQLTDELISLYQSKG